MKSDDPIPRPLPHEKLFCDPKKQYPPGDGSCYPIDLSDTQGFTLKELFGRSIQGTCLGSQGRETVQPPVCISARHSLDVYTVGAVTEHKDSSGLSRCFDIPATGEFEMLVPKQDTSHFHPVATPPLYAERSITGHGQERGGVRILFTNPSNISNVTFVYFENLPWFMKPYLHTLTPSIPGSVSEMYYRPGLDRERGSQLELLITVPPSQTLELAYDFEKAILRYTEYPPDANRGRDVAPAVIRLIDYSPDSTAPSLHQTADGQLSFSASPHHSSMQVPNTGHQKTAYIRTTPLMLPLPTPDFSMPYNVIILTSTVIALAFGTVYNILVRQFIGADEVGGMTPREKIRALFARVKGIISPVKESGEKKHA
jgi:GPI-anchor transamidase subunit T